jgi:uncharacterized hydrophobic protein (TIGR00271 family)
VRQVQILVPDDRREEVLVVLDEWEVDYAITPGDVEEDDYSMVFFPIPTDAVEHVMDDLYEAGLETETYTTVTSTELAVGERVDALQRRWAGTPNTISPRSLESKVRDIRPNTRAFLWMMFLSAILATAGLLQGSPAVIVGSMVIAPIVGPALASSVGLLRGERRMLIDAISSQALGLAVAVVGAALLAALFRLFQLVPPGLAVTDLQFVTVRLAPGLLSLVIGTAAGAAAAYSMVTKGAISLVGVMIAAALVPAAATAGIGLAWNQPLLAIGALLLLILNLAGIDLAGVAMLRYLGYGTTGKQVVEGDELIDGETESSGGDSSYLPGLGSRATLLVTTLAVTVVVLGTGAATAQQIGFERAVNQEVDATLADPAYESLELAEIRYQYSHPLLALDPATVTVTLGRTGEEEYPALAARLDERITRRTGEQVVVRVRFVDYQVSG